MPKFPSREADVALLANRMISGLREQAEDFPNSPHGVDELEAILGAYRKASDAAVSAQGAAAAAVDVKVESLQTLTDSLKVVLRYAEDAVKFDRGKLKNIGWNGRKTRSELEVPGQAGVLGQNARGRHGFS